MNAKMPTFDYVDAILASTNQGLFLVETQDRVYHVNARLLELFGMKKIQIIGWTCTDLFHWLARLSQDTLRTERELRSALENIQQRPSVYLLSKREAIVSRLQIQLFTLPSDGPKTCRWGGLVRDVTAEWQEIAYQAKYASILTRELRLPLAKLKGMMATYIQNRQRWNDDERQRFLDDMYKSIDRSTHLLDDVQEMFRIQTGALSLNR